MYLRFVHLHRISSETYIETYFIERHRKKVFLNTISAKVNHDVSFSIHDPVEFQRCDITPDFKCTKESIINCFFVQIWGVP